MIRFFTVIFVFSSLFSLVPLFPQVNDEEELFLWLNQVRLERNLGLLEKEEILESTTLGYGYELMERGLLTHKDKSFAGPFERYRRQGGTAMAVGEILGTKNHLHPLNTLKKMWLESESHREQILNPEWTTAGLAKVEKEGIEIYVIQFSNSQLTDYQAVKEGRGVTLFFTPHSSCEKLLFYDVLSKKEYVWKKGEEQKIVINRNSSSLLLEVYLRERSYLSNRIIIY